jgi:hypothetical protein
MENIQMMIAAHLRHAHRKRERVVRILEQPVIIYSNRMKIEPRRVDRQSERALVTDEMHLVTALRQFFAQSGS